MKGRLLSGTRKLKERLERSRKQEKRVAKSFAGRLIPGSGNQWHSKGDVETDQFLIENKDRSESNRFSLRKDELRLLRSRAFAAGKKPMLQIDFGKDRYVVMNLDDVKDMGIYVNKGG